MAAGQFSPFRPGRLSRQGRHFTIEQANRSLPLVRRIVRDIVNAHERAMQLQGRLEELTANQSTSPLQAQLDEAMEQLQAYVSELNDVGVELKDYEAGLIDFLARHQGRDVYLCWRLGEETIAYWHELHAGFAGRQPISTMP